MASLLWAVPQVPAAQALVSGPSSQNFGQRAVNAGSPATLTLSFTYSGTGAPTFVAKSGADFAVATSNCTGSGNISCAVSVTFQPHVPGLRQDVLLIKNQAGSVIGTTLLYGTGLGPQIAIYPGIISTIAGTGVWGYSGDGGLATAATMRNPQGVAVDNAGNLYIADSINQVVRQISATTGKISTLAGNGAVGYAGDGGPAIKAPLNTPTAVALDGAGNLYITDQGNNVVRKVDAITQQISTVAGGGGAGSGLDGLGDGGPAINALLNGPSDVAVDGAGNLYIADSFNGLIRKVNAATGIITVVAGGGNSAGSDGLGDGGAATSARLNDPVGIGLDPAGNLFIADTSNSLVRRVDGVSGIITVVAGTGKSGYSGDLGLAIKALLGSPSNVRVDAAGNIYIADQGQNVIRQVNGSSGIITTIAGTGTRRYAGDGSSPASAGLANPAGIALDTAGNLYIADFTNNAIRKIALSGTPVSFAATLVGQASPIQPVSVFNIGNQPLSVSAITVSSNFGQQMLGVSDCAASSVLSSAGMCTIALQFTPTKTGVLTGSLSITSNSSNLSGSTVTMPLSGTAAIGAVPQVSLSIATLTFGNQSLGAAAAAKSVTVSNTGSAPLSLSAIQLTGANAADFSVTTTCQSVVAAGASCSMSVIFMPAAMGARTASLILFDNVANSPQTVTMTGTGGGTPQMALSAASVQFGSQSIGGAGATKTITLSNTGSGPLNIASMALSGENATDFGLTTTCGSAVAAGASCSISASFSPRAIGLRAATLTITDNAGGATQSASLRGTGLTRTVPAVYRPSNGTWYVFSSGNGTPVATRWGTAGDIPVPADYDGDGKIDYAVYRPSNCTWYVIPSSTKQPYFVQWGMPGDMPVPGDYDGDGKADLAVYRPSSGIWSIIPTSTGTAYFPYWGTAGDIPVPGDYDGDGKTDVAVWRPSNCSWYVIPSSTNQPYFAQWGMPGDMPVPGDYDGDGKTDLAVYRPSSGIWSIIPTSTGTAYFPYWGTAGDIPVPGDYDGDGKADVAVWRPSNCTLYVIPSKTGQTYPLPTGMSGDIPLAISPN